MKIVFTNGCFDILHIGHVRLLKHQINQLLNLKVKIDRSSIIIIEKKYSNR